MANVSRKRKRNSSGVTRKSARRRINPKRRQVAKKVTAAAKRKLRSKPWKVTALKRVQAKQNKTPNAPGPSQSQELLKHTFRKPRYRVNNKFGWKYILEGAGTYYTCPEGQQAAILGTPMLTVPQLTTAAAGAAGRFDVLPWDLNPYTRSTGSAAFPGKLTVSGPLPEDVVIGQTSLYDDRIYLSKVTGHMDVLNATGHGIAYVDVYWLLAKHDYDRDPVTSFVNSVVNDGFPNAGPNPPNNTGQPPFVQLGPGGMTAGAPGASAYGLKPYQVPNFGKFWKCFHKNTFVLQPGEQKRTYLNLNVNRTLMRSEFGNIKDANENIYTFRGLTVQAMVVFRGGIVMTNTSTGGVGTQRVSYAPVKIALQDYHKYHFHAMPRSPENSSFTRINPFYWDSASDYVMQVNNEGVITETRLSDGTNVPTVFEYAS